MAALARGSEKPAAHGAQIQNLLRLTDPLRDFHAGEQFPPGQGEPGSGALAAAIRKTFGA